MSQKRYNLVIIGGGWAGFNAALEAKNLGQSVCLIEQSDLGGTCLNRGCIPTKTWTHFAKKYSGGQLADISELKRDQHDVVKKLKGGMEFVLKSQKIDFINERAKVVAADTVLTADSAQEVKADFILIAVGSLPAGLPFLPIDHKRVLSSDDILALESLPASILIVGGGVIGCEFACALAKLGVKVTIVELEDRLVPMFDRDISRKAEQALKKAGVVVKASFDLKGKDLSEYEKILLSVGRKTDTANILDASVSLDLNKDGTVKVDVNLKTSIPNIYAAGDCVGGLQLAHVASYEARLAVRNIFGEPKSVDYQAAPSSVFTVPEFAQIGLTEDAAKNESRPVKVVKKFFLSVGMAHILKETDGFIKLIIDKDSNVIIGASIFGPQATELINTIALAIHSKHTTQDLKDLVFAHPSISEVFTEAVQ